jgi:radical SAM superfamily enzyme YgiQ (UPF0313 family)
MTKVLLIQPNYNIDSKDKMTPWMPIALVELATYIKEKGHEAIILDRNIHPEESILLNKIKEFNPDIIGMTCYTSLVIKDVLNIAKLTKENSKALVIIGGIHATLEPKSLLDIPDIDFVVRGEGEMPLLEICNIIKEKGIDKEAIAKVQNVNYNDMFPLLDLKTVPMPDYDLLEVKQYRTPTFYTSRGCMGQCKFCYNRGRRLRFYDTDKVIKVMTGVIEKYNIKEFTIADDNFATLGERTERICDALSKYDVIFQCFLRADQAHEEVIKNLKKAGCWVILFGFESGSQRVLDFINKRTLVEQNAKAISMCHKYNIFVEGSFIVGLPTETEDEMKETMAFIDKYKPDSADINIFKPFPHTDLYELCIAEGSIKNPQNLKEWIPYCNINSANPNFSKIPTEAIIAMVAKYNKTSKIAYMKKFVLLLLNGRWNYAYLKVKTYIVNRTKMFLGIGKK